MAYVRTVKTTSGATAVQIVHGKRRGARRMEHIGSAHDEHELEALKTAAAQRLALLHPQLDLGLDGTDGADGGGVTGGPAVVGPGPLPIVSSRAGPLWDGLSAAYDLLGFEQASGRDEVFRQLVLARIIEPTSKADSLRGAGRDRHRPGPVLLVPQASPAELGHRGVPPPARDGLRAARHTAHVDFAAAASPLILLPALPAGVRIETSPPVRDPDCRAPALVGSIGSGADAPTGPTPSSTSPTTTCHARNYPATRPDGRDC